MNRTNKISLNAAVQTQMYSGGVWRQAEITLADEHPLIVYLNNRPYCSMVCSPGHQKELVLGRLYTDGQISGITDVAELTVSGSDVCVTLYREPVQSEPRNPMPVSWEPEWIQKVAALLFEKEPFGCRTPNVHSCILLQNGNMVCTMEDIGRHNAMDKVIGWALQQNVDLHRCMLFSSGRLPTDMVGKAVRAGISLLAAKGRPTTAAVKAAAQHGITLLYASKNGEIYRF